MFELLAMRLILSWILNIAIYAGIVAAIVWGIPHILQKKLGTEDPIAVVTSSSMWPALKAGDVVFIEAVDRDKLEVGNILVWQKEGSYTIHRLVRLEETTVVTKGDANFKEDDPVPYESVVGRAAVRGNGKPYRVPYLGFASNVGQAIRNFSLANAIRYERAP
jgi:signal peptidase I